MASKKISNLSLIHTIFALENFAKEQDDYFRHIESSTNKAKLKEATEDVLFSLEELKEILRKRIRKAPELLELYYKVSSDLNHITY
jgi:hypothetical protein